MFCLVLYLFIAICPVLDSLSRAEIDTPGHCFPGEKMLPTR